MTYLTGIKIVSLNVRSIRAPSQFNVMYNWMMANEIGILLAQETHLTQDLATKYQGTYPNISIMTNCQHRHSRGVTTIVNNKLAAWWEPTDVIDPDVPLYTRDDDGRFLISRIMVGRHKLSVANIYAPADATRGHYFISISDQLEGSIPIDIIGGDWNMVEAEIDRSSVRQVPREQVLNLHRLLYEVSNDGNDMIDGWRARNEDTIAYSHKNSNEGSSRIDRIYVGDHLLGETKDWDMKLSPLDTDHSSVEFTLVTGGVQRGPGRWRLNPLILKNRTILKATTTALEMVTDLNPLTGWIAYKEEIGRTYQGLMKQNKVQNNRKLETLKIKRQRLQRRRRRGHVDSVLEDSITAAMGNEKQLTEYEARNYTYNSMAKYKLLGEKPNKWFYARTKACSKTGISIMGLRSPDGELRTDPAEMLELAEEFYEDLYSVKNSDSDARKQLLSGLSKKISVRWARRLTKPISTREIKSSIRRAATGKVPGLDGLPAEFYKALLLNVTEGQTPLVVKTLQRIFHHIQNGGDIPEVWKTGTLSLLYKNKGDPQLLRNYRPLSIMNVDYKIFTEILMQRLLKALTTVIGNHQSAFLPGRLIDDNVRTAQYLIETFRHSEEDASILFLDQEKAYDRVSHSFLWRSLNALGIPKAFIDYLRALYRDAKITIFINGHQSAPISVRSGVRQGDPISCPLFLIAIESLAVALFNSELITGVKLSNQTVKCLMYADDTAVFIRNQVEADAVKEILDLYNLASGAKVNWEKSYLLHISGSMPKVSGAIKVDEEHPYVHLGIPVGLNTEQQVADHWSTMINRLQASVTQWLKCHMSLKGRVMIANSMLLSVPRYSLRFIELPEPTAKLIEKEYYRMIWDDKSHGHIKDKHSVLPVEKGGVGALSLTTIRDAVAVSFIGQMEAHPELAWVQLAKPLMIGAESRTQSLNQRSLLKPWIQKVSSRAPKAPLGLKHIWPRWNRLWGLTHTNIEGILSIKDPENLEEVLHTMFWYHPSLKVTPGVGARRFASKAWKLLLTIAEVPMTLGQLWSTETKSPKVFSEFSTTDKNLINKAILALIRDLPDTWTALLLNDTAESEDFSDIRQECYVNIKKKAVPINKVSFTEVYKELIQRRSDSDTFTDKVRGPVSSYRRLTGKDISISQLWRGARSQFSHPKAGDLLWRFLHEKVITGPALTWLEEADQKCPIDNEPQTIQHIWIECNTAIGVWKTFSTIYTLLTNRTPIVPNNVDDLVALMALGPYNHKIDNRRWRILYSEAVWAIWKAYLTYSFKETKHSLHPEGVKALYKKALIGRIHVDRALTVSSTYSSKTYTKRTFFTLWNQDPFKLRVLQTPDCLTSTEI